TITPAATDVTRSCNASALKGGGRRLRRTCTPSVIHRSASWVTICSRSSSPIVGTLRHPSQGNRDYGPHTPRPLSQKPDHETRDLVDERSDRFVREHVGMVQDRCMRQRIDSCHADECRKPQVDGAKLIAVSLKIGPDEDKVFAIEGFDVLEAPGARYLLRKDAMELGIDAMRLDRRGDHPAHRLLDRLRGDLGQRGTDDLHDVLVVTIDDSGNERLLAGEILVERADA